MRQSASHVEKGDVNNTRALSSLHWHFWATESQASESVNLEPFPWPLPPLQRAPFPCFASLRCSREGGVAIASVVSLCGVSGGALCGVPGGDFFCSGKQSSSTDVIAGKVNAPAFEA